MTLLLISQAWLPKCRWQQRSAAVAAARGFPSSLPAVVGTAAALMLLALEHRSHPPDQPRTRRGGPQPQHSHFGRCRPLSAAALMLLALEYRSRPPNWLRTRCGGPQPQHSQCILRQWIHCKCCGCGEGRRIECAANWAHRVRNQLGG